MEIKEIRRRNLDVLAAEAESLEAIAAAVRRAKKTTDPESASKNYANYLSQIRTGNRKMGDATARNLEAGMGKPEGWMDQPQFELAEVEMMAKEAAEIIKDMDPETRAVHMRILRLSHQDGPKKSAANPFGAVPRPHKPTRSGGTQ